MNFRNNEHLEVVIQNICDKAVHDTSVELKAELEKMTMKYFYKKYKPKYYQRKYRLAEMVSEQRVGLCMEEILMDTAKVSYSGIDTSTNLEMMSQGIHGNKYIQTDGRFWEEFEKYMTPARIKQRLKKNLKKYGLEVK